MPMGLKCSAEIFQREMCRIFNDLPGVEIVVDDILVHGRDTAEHDQRLRQVLQRCRDVNLKLNSSKSKLRSSEVDYVGHKLTARGLLPQMNALNLLLVWRIQKITQSLPRFGYGRLRVKVHSEVVYFDRAIAKSAEIR